MSLQIPRQHKHFFTAVILSIMAVLLIAGSAFHVFAKNELDTLDLRFRLRRVLPVSDKIVIIEIGDDSIRKLGAFPFDREYHALLVKALAENGAQAVMFDMFFSEATKSDASFADAMKAAGNVYLPVVFEMKAGDAVASGYAAQELDIFRKSARGSGHINVSPDPDGKYRRVPLLVQYDGGLYPYLSFSLIAGEAGVSEQDIRLVPGRYIQFGKKMAIPLDAASNMIVNVAGAWGRAYQHYSYVDVLQSYAARLSGQKPNLDLNMLRGKICLVGLTATGSTDLHPNPFGPLNPALGMHADVINSILMKRFIYPAPRALNVLFLLMLIGAMGWAVSWNKPLKGLGVLLLLIAFYSGLCVALFVGWGLWVDMFYPLVVVVLIYLMATLYMYLKEWTKRFLWEKELMTARKIQQSFLPKELPVLDGLDVAATMSTARHVGGDLYDFYEFGTNRLGVMIGDVSGKGIPASLFMAMVSGAIKFFTLADTHPAETLHHLNVKIVRESTANLFVTIFYALFDIDKNVMTYANGGHLPALYLPKDSAAQFLDADEGLPIGMLEGLYSGHQVCFGAGDIFVFYTDGITEAKNHQRQMYGVERLKVVVELNRALTAGQILEAIEKDVRQFEPRQHQHDDITFIVMKISGGKA
ncbi:MAG: CHASE2 domain-containing protein [Candidatus Omnitrophica bacterium]|nr:CHASE2 domain-containing protein [Candidatus Omnitrophota bacterium]